MIEWFTWLQAGIAVLAGLICLIAGLAGRTPSDYTVGSVALVLLLHLVQLPVSIVQSFNGNPAVGDPVEYWMYWAAALLVLLLALAWALLERDRWATVVLGIAGLTLAVMVWRMQVVWANGAPLFGAGS